MAETSERPKGKSLRPLRELAPFLRPYLGTLYLAMAALVLASAAQLALPVAIRYLIDAGLLAQSAASIDRYFLGLFLVAVAFSLFSALRFYFIIWLGERVVADIRTAVFDRMIGMSPSYFERIMTGAVPNTISATLETWPRPKTMNRMGSTVIGGIRESDAMNEANSARTFGISPIATPSTRASSVDMPTP